MITATQLQTILLESLTAPKEVQNDSGKVTSQDLDKIVKALEYANKLNSAENPFKCVRQQNIRKKDAWR